MKILLLVLFIALQTGLVCVGTTLRSSGGVVTRGSFREVSAGTATAMETASGTTRRSVVTNAADSVVTADLYADGDTGQSDLCDTDWGVLVSDLLGTGCEEKADDDSGEPDETARNVVERTPSASHPDRRRVARL